MTTGRAGGAATRARATYFEALSSVRRQRVQTSALTGDPLRSMTSGCRLGCMRRWARTRFDTRRLRVEPAHRDLAADRAGAGHVIPQEAVQRQVHRADGPERGGMIAHASGHARRESPRREDPSQRGHPSDARPIARHRPRACATSSARRPSVRTASPASPAARSRRLFDRLGLAQPGLAVRIDDGIEIELDLTVALGVPVAEVARQVDSAIRYAIRRALDRDVAPASSSTSTVCTSRRAARFPSRRPRCPSAASGPRDLADSGTDVA